MSAVELPRPNGLRGRTRPQSYRRIDVASLRINGLVADVAAERDRHDDAGSVYALLDSAAAILQDAAEAASPPDPA